MKRALKFSIIFTVLALFLTSCLTVEKKEYTFEFTGKNSGTLTIKYTNIMSMPDYMGDEDDGIETEIEYGLADYEDLLETYINGNTVESNYPNATNVQKRLFEEDGKLCGEVKMDFANLEAARLYQHCKKSPIMFNISNTLDGEYYSSSNGELGNPDFMNVVFWKSGTKKLTVSTSVTSPDDDTVELLKYFKKN